MESYLIPIGFGILGIAIPYALVLARSYVNTNFKNAKLNAWANGAISFAGQAYIDLVAARQANPTKPLKELIDDTVKNKATEFLASYQQTANVIGATKADAISKVAGALGDKLANDPTVSVAVATVTPNLTNVSRPIGSMASS